MINIEIEKNVPLPKTSRPSFGFSLALSKLQIGDSFLIPLGNEKSTTVGNRIRSRANYTRVSIAIRKQGESLRVWRVK